MTRRGQLSPDTADINPGPWSIFNMDSQLQLQKQLQLGSRSINNSLIDSLGRHKQKTFEGKGAWKLILIFDDICSLLVVCIQVSSVVWYLLAQTCLTRSNTTNSSAFCCILKLWAKTIEHYNHLCAHNTREVPPHQTLVM